MLLAKEQRIGAAILFGIALVVWLGIAIWNGCKNSDAPEPSESPNKSNRWEAHKDSVRRAQSERFAQWTVENEQRYDSFRRADRIRREAFKQERQQFWDSVRIADSLWRDSVGWKFARRIKKDTILDLNHCDTTELQYMRGIGSYTAKQIILYREQLGGYYSPEQLADSTLARYHLDTLTSHFTANAKDVKTLNVNTCNADILKKHPYIRYEQARAIYTLRRQRVKLKSIDELRELPELSEKDIDRLTPYLRFE